jgi:carbonic anhydrase
VLNATKESAKRTAARLASASKLIGGMVKDGKVKIVAAVYDLATGEVGWLG